MLLLLLLLLLLRFVPLLSVFTDLIATQGWRPW
jgi:hypothetical protein